MTARARQRDKISWLVKKKWTPKKVHENLEKEFGRLAYSYRCVVYHCSLVRKKVSGASVARNGRPRHKLVDEKIWAAHIEDPDLSVRKLAARITEPRETVRRHMIDIGARKGALPRIPHDLTSSQRSSRVTMSKTLLGYLKDKKKWPRIITGDETWVYLTNQQKFGWFFPGDEPRRAVDRQQGDKKVMLVTFLSSRGFKAIKFLPEGATIDARICCDLFRCIRMENDAPLWIHMDNASPHRAKLAQSVLTDLQIFPLPHPPYSPDLAPCDFWLYGRLKYSLGSAKFSTVDELQERVLEELHKIQVGEIRRVYNEWIRRLERCIESQGDYVHISH